MFLKLSKFCLYASIFSVILVITGTFFPFIGVKYFFFRTSVSLALVFFVLWWAFESPKKEVVEHFKKISRHPLFIAVSAFVLVYLLASLFAYDSHAAFWSNYERGEGGFQMIHYYLFFLLLGLTFRDKKDWHRIFQLSLAAAGLMILYGVMAQFGAKGFISPVQGDSSHVSFSDRLLGPRFQGSLGNPAYVAPYLMFAMFYCAYLWTSSESKRRQLMHILYGFLTAFFLFFFYLSKTRGALVGLVIAILAFLVYLLIFSENKTKKWAISGLSFFALFAILIGFVSFYLAPLCSKPSANCSNFSNNLVSNRLLNLGPGDQTFQTRMWTWNSAFEGFKDRPILGWGPENFSAVFDKHFDPRHYIVGTSAETWFDRAHSVVFDYLAETGLLGLLSYLTIFGVFFWQFFKNKKHASHAAGQESKSSKLFRNPILAGLILVLPIGYFVQGLALFDVLPIYLNLFLFLAFGVYQLNQKNELAL